MIHVTPIAQGLQGMHDCKIAFAAHSRAAAFVSPDQPAYSFESLATLPSVRIYSTEERRLHTTCLETAKKAMESFGLFE